MISFSSSTELIHSPPDLIEVLGAVDEADVAVGVDRGDVAGAQPAVVGERLGRRARRRSRSPAIQGPRHLQLAAGLAVPRQLVGGVGVDDAELDAERDPARPWRAGRPAPRRRGRAWLDAGRPAAIGLVSVMPQACRIGSPILLAVAPPTAPSAPPSRRTGWPAATTCRGPSSSGEHAHPDGGHAGGDGDPLVDRSGRRCAGPDRSGPGITSVGAGGDARRGRGPRRWRGTSARPAGSRRSRGRRGCRPSSRRSCAARSSGGV